MPKDFDAATHVWPISVVGHQEQLKVGDVFTMEVPVDPVTGLFSALECGGVLEKRTFKVSNAAERLGLK